MRKIALTQGKVALIDNADYRLVKPYTWHTMRVGCGLDYAATNVDGELIYMHRLLLGLTRGDKRRGDHKNHDGLDNRRKNLRIATYSQDQHNARIAKHNKSGLKGVWWKARERKWEAGIYIMKKQVFLGRYPTPEQAAAAYDAAAVKYFGKFACTNAMLTGVPSS